MVYLKKTRACLVRNPFSLGFCHANRVTVILSKHCFNNRTVYTSETGSGSNEVTRHLLWYWHIDQINPRTWRAVGSLSSSLPFPFSSLPVVTLRRYVVKPWKRYSLYIFIAQCSLVSSMSLFTGRWEKSRIFSLTEERLEQVKVNLKTLEQSGVINNRF